MAKKLEIVTQRLELANQLADVAGAIILRYFRSNITFEEDKDAVSSIVTVADKNAEKAMRELIANKFPNDKILGEEFGVREGSSGYTWVIDPIDGTSSFVRGLPIFGILIALVDEDGTPLFGICDQPYLKERFIGVAHERTRFIQNGNMRLLGDKTGGSEAPSLTLKDLCLASTSPFMFVTEEEQRRSAELQKACKKKAWGGDCYNYMMLALGANLLVLESDMKYYDFCALIPILKGAGAFITDWQGRELSQESTQVLAAPNDTLLIEALTFLGA